MSFFKGNALAHNFKLAAVLKKLIKQSNRLEKKYGQ
jgi:hypothetical protein